MDLITVILPSFNSAQTICRAIDSVLGQTGIKIEFNIQLIVVDDCSTDSTVEILKGYPTVELFVNSKNSGGPNKGRNIGLENAKGQYIMFIDHDDEWLPNKVREQLKLKVYPVVSCGFNVISPLKPTISVGVRQSEKYEIFETNESFRNLLSRNVYGQTTYFGTLMIHDSLKSFLFEEEYGVCDYDYILKILKDRKSAQVNLPLFNRFSDGKNLSFNERYRECDYRTGSKVLDFYKNEYPTEVEVGKEKLNAMMGRFYYLMGNPKNALRYFSLAKKGPVNLLFILLLKTGLHRFFPVNLFKF